MVRIMRTPRPPPTEPPIIAARLDMCPDERRELSLAVVGETMDPEVTVTLTGTVSIGMVEKTIGDVDTGEEDVATVEGKSVVDEPGIDEIVSGSTLLVLDVQLVLEVEAVEAAIELVIDDDVVVKEAIELLLVAVLDVRTRPTNNNRSLLQTVKQS